MGDYSRPPADNLTEALRIENSNLRRQLRDLQQAPGTNIASLVEQVQQTLANINAAVAAAVSANSYTQTQINDRIANQVSYFGTTAVGNLTTSGTATVQGGITAIGQVYSEQPLRSPGSRNYVATTSYVAGWINSDGTIGTVPSSIRFKTNVADAEIDPYAIMNVPVKTFQYINEVRKRDDPTYEEYVGPEYHVSLNTNVIAEMLHEAGLWQFVVYERDPVYKTVVEELEDGTEVEREVHIGDTLRLDENGEAIPFSVHNSMFGVMLIPTVQDMVRRIDQIESDNVALKKRLDDAGIA